MQSQFNTNSEDRKKKRGRPKGSKNKTNVEEPPLKRIKSFRERAEQAASCSLSEDSEVCLICMFRFDDPLKKDKEITHCPHCNIRFHEPCLRKSGFTECL